MPRLRPIIFLGLLVWATAIGTVLWFFFLGLVGLWALFQKV